MNAQLHKLVTAVIYNTKSSPVQVPTLWTSPPTLEGFDAVVKYGCEFIISRPGGFVRLRPISQRKLFSQGFFKKCELQHRKEN